MDFNSLGYVSGLIVHFVYVNILYFFIFIGVEWFLSDNVFILLLWGVLVGFQIWWVGMCVWVPVVHFLLEEVILVIIRIVSVRLF